MDIFTHNQRAWDHEALIGSPWTIPASPEEIARARQGELSILLSPKKPLPADWLGDLEGRDILCLASAGGQQGPLLAAAGANVTVLDASASQLERDREVARREKLMIMTLQGNMADLGELSDSSYDMVIVACSTCFVPDILPVWRECARVLKAGGELLVGFVNPIYYAVDRDLAETGEHIVRYQLPYSDVAHSSPQKLNALVEALETLEFGHSLEDLIGGQISCGFEIIGFFEDYWGIAELDKFYPSFINTRARKK